MLQLSGKRTLVHKFIIYFKLGLMSVEIEGGPGREVAAEVDPKKGIYITS